METILITVLLLWNIVQRFQIKDLQNEVESRDSFRGIEIGTLTRIIRNLETRINDIEGNDKG